MYAKHGRLGNENNRTVIEPQIWIARNVGFGRIGVAVLTSSLDIDTYSGAF